MRSLLSSYYGVVDDSADAEAAAAAAREDVDSSSFDAQSHAYSASPSAPPGTPHARQLLL